MSEKPYRIRVRVLDGKPRSQKDLNKLKSNILGMAHLDIFDAKGGVELIVCASQEKHLADVRAKLHHAGLEEIEGGDTSVPAAARPMPQQGSRQDMSQDRGRRERSKRQQPGSARGSSEEPPSDLRKKPYGFVNGTPLHTSRAQTSEEPPSDLRKKPYGFVGLPERFTTAEPVWHDGTSSADRLSGEVRFELETLTPLLVGWERGQVGDAESEWPVPETLNGVGHLAQGKSVLCPLRAPWGKRPVIIPGDTLKGLLRHELGALLGAPMERVAERSYSYRPNAMFPKDPNPRLIARLARIPEEGVEIVQLDGIPVRVPSKLELLSTSLRYDKSGALSNNYYRFIKSGGLCYRGGIGAGHTLNSKHKLFQGILAVPSTPTQTINVPQTAKHGYLATLRHLVDLDHGHFSERHPDVIETIIGEAAKKRISKRHPDVLKTITGEAAKNTFWKQLLTRFFNPAT